MKKKKTPNPIKQQIETHERRKAKGRKLTQEQHAKRAEKRKNRQ